MNLNRKANDDAPVLNAVAQSGENEGKKTGNKLFCFNSRWSLNEQAVPKEHAYHKEVSAFNRSSMAFTSECTLRRRRRRYTARCAYSTTRLPRSAASATEWRLRSP